MTCGVCTLCGADRCCLAWQAAASAGDSALRGVAKLDSGHEFANQR